MARDKAVENWLQAQVGTAYDALKADPSRAVSCPSARAPCSGARLTMSYRVIFAPEAVEQLAVLHDRIKYVFDIFVYRVPGK